MGTDALFAIRLKDMLMEYFGIPDNAYAYMLEREKSAFSEGTMTFEDFKEFDENTIDEMVDYIRKRREQIMRGFDVVLIEKEGLDGLTKKECSDLYGLLNEPKGYPIEICNLEGETSAMGFIGVKADKELEYDHENLSAFIKDILGGAEMENGSGCYQFRGQEIYLGRRRNHDGM